MNGAALAVILLAIAFVFLVRAAALAWPGPGDTRRAIEEDAKRELRDPRRLLR